MTSRGKQLRSLFHRLSGKKSIPFAIGWWKQGQLLNLSGCNVSVYVYWFNVAERVGLCNSAVLSSVCLSIHRCTHTSMFSHICLFYVQETCKETYGRSKGGIWNSREIPSPCSWKPHDFPEHTGSTGLLSQQEQGDTCRVALWVAGAEWADRDLLSIREICYQLERLRWFVSAVAGAMWLQDQL